MQVSWVGKIPWRREWLPTPVFLPGEFHAQRSLLGYSPWNHKESDTTEIRIALFDFPGGSVGKESAYNVGDLGLIPGLGRSPGEGNGNPLQYSYLENFMDRGTWRATLLGVSELDVTEWPTYTHRPKWIIRHNPCGNQPRLIVTPLSSENCSLHTSTGEAPASLRRVEWPHIWLEFVELTANKWLQQKQLDCFIWEFCIETQKKSSLFSIRLFYV